MFYMLAYGIKRHFQQISVIYIVVVSLIGGENNRPAANH